MGGQRIHKRLSREFVEDILEAFNEKGITEEMALELLGIKRARLYRMREGWLRCKARGEEFSLWNRKGSKFHKFSGEVEEWLHKELKYIRTEADLYRGIFNFAFLAEIAERQFQRGFQRNSIRLFALRHGYYHALPEEKSKVYTRFETSGPGALFQHDTSQHLWIPLLGQNQSVILTLDDYSRKVLGAVISEKETTASHLSLTRQVVERYGLPFAYYVDNHSIFRFVERESRHYRHIVGESEAEVQFKRALSSIGVGLIYTGEGRGAAKGKVEKKFDYFQRRLPYICEKKGIRKVEDAQAELDELVAFYNDCRVHHETGEIPSKRWDKAIEGGKGKISTLNDSLDLDWVFSLHYERTVQKDGTLDFYGKHYKVGRYPRQRVTVSLIPDSKIMFYKGTNKICEYHL